MSAKKKIILGIAIAVFICALSVVIYCVATRDNGETNNTTTQPPITETPPEITPPETKPNKNPLLTEDEAPVLRLPTTPDDIDDDDEVIVDDNGNLKAIKDIEKYITYDYIALVVKDEKVIKTQNVNDMIMNYHKYQKPLISQEVIDEYTEYYNSLPEESREGMTLEEAMATYLFDKETFDIGIGKDKYNAKYLSYDKAWYILHETDKNVMKIVLYKDAFVEYKDFYQASYELFVETIKKFDAETIKESIILKKQYTNETKLYQKIDAEDWDFLYNAMMNDCITFMYETEDITVAFGRDEIYAEDDEYHRGFFMNIEVRF